MTESVPHVVDTCAWTGHWGALRLPGAAADVVTAVTQVGATRVLLSPLDGAFAHNPHLLNDDVYAAAEADERVRPAPVLDPTIATWPEQLARAGQAGAPLVRWLPAYGGFELTAVDECAAAVGDAGCVLWVQTRLEDPRRQHPLALVADVPAMDVMALAERHPQVPVVLGGATWKTIVDLAEAILGLEHVYADVSQADGMDSLLRMVEAGLTQRLLFGTHAPFFEPLAGVARVVLDLEEADASAVLGGNALRLMPCLS